MLIKCFLYSSPKFHNLENKGQVIFCAMAAEFFSLPKGFIKIYELEVPPAEQPFSLISILYHNDTPYFM